MTLEWVHPGLLLILGAWVLPLLKGRVKRGAMLILPIAALAVCLRMTPGTYGEVSFLGQDVVFGRVDKLSLIPARVLTFRAPAGSTPHTAQSRINRRQKAASTESLRAAGPKTKAPGRAFRSRSKRKSKPTNGQSTRAHSPARTQPAATQEVTRTPSTEWRRGLQTTRGGRRSRTARQRSVPSRRLRSQTRGPRRR